MLLLTYPRYNIAQHANKKFHAACHMFELLLIGVVHVKHGQPYLF